MSNDHKTTFPLECRHELKQQSDHKVSISFLFSLFLSLYFVLVTRQQMTFICFRVAYFAKQIGCVSASMPGA